MFEVKGNNIIYKVEGEDDVVIGPKTSLFKDKGESYPVNGSKDVTLPERVDLIFAVGEGLDKVAGFEVKKTPDLITSWVAHRLQRQLRFIRHNFEVGGLMIRCSEGFWVFELEDDLRHDLLKLQVEGGYILFGPDRDEDMESFIKTTAEILRGVKNLKTIFSGEDKKYVSGSRKQKAVQGLLRGVGKKRSSKLLKVFKSVDRILSCSDEEFLRAGGGKQGLKSRKELL